MDSDHTQDSSYEEFPSAAAPTPQLGASTVVFQQVRRLYSSSRIHM